MQPQLTAVASLSSGRTYTMPPETLGYEWDSDSDNGYRPAGEIDMSQTWEKRPADWDALGVIVREGASLGARAVRWQAAPSAGGRWSWPTPW
jgi:hypothetical protein